MASLNLVNLYFGLQDVRLTVSFSPLFTPNQYGEIGDFEPSTRTFTDVAQTATKSVSNNADAIFIMCGPDLRTGGGGAAAASS